MSVTEVHGALGLDKLKNRTFQIFKVVQINVYRFDGLVLSESVALQTKKNLLTRSCMKLFDETVCQASATKGEGLDESMEWLSNTLQNKK